MKADIILRMRDGKIWVFENVERWSDYEDKHETLIVKYERRSTPRKIKIKEIDKFVLISDREIIVRDYKD